MTENKRFTYLNYSKKGYIGSFYLNDKPITTKEVWELLKKQKEEITSLKSSNMELEDANARLEELIQELYDFRMLYNALAFNALYKQDEIVVYKSKRHYDGELCFDGEYFVVVAILPTGQITNHYHIDYWDLFQIPSKIKIEHEFDGHTPETVIQRLDDFLRNSELVRP